MMLPRQLARVRRRAYPLLGVVLAAGLCAPAGASAQSPRAYLRLATSEVPTHLTPNGKGELVVTATNLGDAPLSGELLVVDVLPPGLTAVAVRGSLADRISFGLACALKAPQEVSCAYRETEPLAPLTGLKLVITVQVGAAVTAANRVQASGASSATSVSPIELGSEPAAFGVERYELKPEEEGGAPDVRAGSHPFQLTTALALTETAKEEPVALTKNLRFSLPAGLIGNPQATSEKCSQADFNTELPGGTNLCKPGSVVGEAQATIEEPQIFENGPGARTVPIFNLEPAPGEPARFGMTILKDPIVLETSVRTGGDYGVVVTAKSTSQLAGLISTTATFWGVPGDPRHNPDRGWLCAAHGAAEPSGAPYAACEAQQKAEAQAELVSKQSGEYRDPKPFLVLPTSCQGPLSAPAEVQSWVPGAAYQPPVESQSSEVLEGCGLLGVDPQISVEPESSSGSTPAGMTVTVATAQAEATGPSGDRLVESAVKSTTVILPEGVELNPAAAGGLLSCSPPQVGFLGTPESAQTQNLAFSPEPASCPDAAKIATVAIQSPDLEHELTGFAYLASQNTSPFQAPLVLYLVARDPVSGVLVKLAGSVSPNPVTGQLTSTFENTPQVPFNHIRLTFFGGARASQSTPPLCGVYTTNATLTPWAGGPPTSTSSNFTITSGPAGTACAANPLPFAPSFTAGSTDLQAGSFTSFALMIARPDGNQALTDIAVHLPPGMAALLSAVTPCPEPPTGQQWSCGAASLLGHAVTSSGLGGEPVSLSGQVYITSGYDGAPFGLLVETAAKAGPFDLGIVDVRSRINVDPSTAAVTITTDGGPRGESVPSRLKGVPVQLKQITVTIDRPAFQFNPTNCNPKSIAATLTGAQGAPATVSSPFQVAGCAALPFAPALSASAAGHGSKANGTTLRVDVTSAGLAQANIEKVNLQLPLQLPSRLTTIQKACLATVFATNPAACPEGSDIGRARIHTPVLRAPLEGPAYLVSHGGAAFPDIEFVLQGEGILLILDGHTDIKRGITYSRFEAAPDAPFSSFETELPAGPHSALTTFVPSAKNYDLCGTKLSMPTEIVGQNGAVIRRVTKVGVTGCGGTLAFKATRRQLLARALKTCRAKARKRARPACERRARKRYGRPGRGHRR